MPEKRDPVDLIPEVTKMVKRAMQTHGLVVCEVTDPRKQFSLVEIRNSSKAHSAQEMTDGPHAEPESS